LISYRFRRNFGEAQDRRGARCTDAVVKCVILTRAQLLLSLNVNSARALPRL